MAAVCSAVGLHIGRAWQRARPPAPYNCCCVRCRAWPRGRGPARTQEGAEEAYERLEELISELYKDDEVRTWLRRMTICHTMQ